MKKNDHSSYSLNRTVDSQEFDWSSQFTHAEIPQTKDDSFSLKHSVNYLQIETQTSQINSGRPP